MGVQVGELFFIEYYYMLYIKVKENLTTKQIHIDKGLSIIIKWQREEWEERTLQLPSIWKPIIDRTFRVESLILEGEIPWPNEFFERNFVTSLESSIPSFAPEWGRR